LQVTEQKCNTGT